MGKFAARDWIGFQGHLGPYPEVLVAVLLRTVWNLLPADRADNYLMRSSVVRCHRRDLVLAVHVMSLPERRRAFKAHARLGLFGSRNYSRGIEDIDATLSWLFRIERYRLGKQLWASDYAAASFGNPDNGVRNG